MKCILLAPVIMPIIGATALAQMQCPPLTNSSSGQFGVLNGTLYGPDQRPFVARGVNTGLDRPNRAEQIQAAFPGVNFVRLAVNNYPTPDTLAPIVSSLTKAGIVVEIEDHHSSDGGDRGGAMGSVFTGPQLTTELNWYSSIASAFRNNPYVWFGTNNEPPGPPDALSQWQKQTYDAIRNTGNNSPIMLEAGVGATPMGEPLTASAYRGMTNVLWDVHFYGWVSGYSTDPSTVSSALATAVQRAQSIQGAAGRIPVIVGEYGNSTTGQTIDQNAKAVIDAVQSAVQSGTLAGSAAWILGTGNPGDGLLNANGSLSSYGQQVAAGIAAGGAVGCVPTFQSTSQTAINSYGSTTVNATGAATTVTSDGFAYTDANGTITVNPSPVNGTRGQTPQTGGSLTAPNSTMSLIPPASGCVSWYVCGDAGAPSQSIDYSQPTPTVQNQPPPQSSYYSAPPIPPAQPGTQNAMQQSSWWARNPAADAAEKALCSAPENPGAALWEGYCNAANGGAP